MLSGISTSILQSARRTIKVLSMVSIFHHIHLCFVALLIQPVTHMVSFASTATALSAAPPPPKAAACLVMAVVVTVLALVLVIQGAALHIQLAKAAMVAAVVDITAPTVTRVAAA
jgi:hypothetical protein